jgi:hypothetical protein
VFIEEADLMTEADKEAGKPPLLLGESFMMANLGKACMLPFHYSFATVLSVSCLGVPIAPTTLLCTTRCQFRHKIVFSFCFLTCTRMSDVNTGIFHGYLAYNEAEFKALKSKGGAGAGKDKKKK